MPRHRKKELATALVGVNIGVLGVAIVLGNSSIGAGLGLGLFGVLSIIRLRSTELSQTDVAYYFASLVAGMTGETPIVGATIIATIVCALAVVDSKKIFAHSHNYLMVVNRAVANMDELKTCVGEKIGRQPAEIKIQKIDYINDSTWVEVRS